MRASQGSSLSRSRAVLVMYFKADQLITHAMGML